MKDKHIADELSAYLDGEAPEPEKIARHLQVCPECSRRYLEMRTLSAGLRNLPAPPASPGFDRRVMARISESARPTLRWRPVFALAAAILVCLAGWTLWPEARSSQPAGAPLAWNDPDTLAAELGELVAEGADLSWIEEGETDPLEAEAEESLTYDEVSEWLAAASDEDLSLEDTSWDEDDPFEMMESLGEDETAALIDLLEDYRNKG